MTVQIMEKHPDITALVAWDAHTALGAVLGFRSLGLRVPDDVSIVSLGNVNSFELIDPPVTAMDQPYEEIGRVAAKRLLEIIDGPEKSPPKAIHLESTLLKRGSVLSLQGQSSKWKSRIRSAERSIEAVPN